MFIAIGIAALAVGLRRSTSAALCVLLYSKAPQMLITMRL